MFYNNDTCRIIVVIFFVYMSDNTSFKFSFVFNKTENKMCIKFVCQFCLTKLLIV